MINSEKKYSVLMSVYYKEKSDFLRESMNSMWKQTVQPSDFVLVCDGPLTDDLNAVIDEMKEKFGNVLNVIRIEKNQGLGRALNIGIQHCKNALVARMDSDDISRPDRCESQLDIFVKNPQLSIVSGTVEEFSESINEIRARRILPEKQESIVEFAKSRNPYNHPCVMYKKSAVEEAGGYQDFYLLEDYYLWLRMIQNGAIGYNIQRPLLWMRAGSEMYKRRSGRKYAKSQRALFKYMKQTGFITKWQYFKNVLIRSIVSITPNGIRILLYKATVRKERRL